MLNRIKRRLSIKNQNSIYFFSVVVGIVSGLAAMLFSFVLTKAEILILSVHGDSINQNNSFTEKITRLFSSPYHSLLILLIPAFGGLAAGLITYFFCKEAKGTGTDEMIDAFHNHEGKIDTKVPFYKSIATIFTLSSGGSGGKEGPISQIGAGIGVFVANIANAGARARRTLLLSGTAAGLGAAFKTPLGGALTAVEMVYKEDIESDALIPCFISSVTAYLIYTTYAGTSPLMDIGDVSSFHFAELGFYLLLGLLCYLFGFLFIFGFKRAKKFTLSIQLPIYLKPAIGGLLTGVIALLFFEVAGTGHHFIEYTTNGNLPDLFGNSMFYSFMISLLVIAFLKIIATTLTIGSGGSAGIFGPSLFIGAMLGAVTGVAAKTFLPGTDVHIGSYVVVGMGAFYAGVANAPIAGIIMIMEMTGSYELLTPIIIVSIFTFILSRQISFYKNQVDNRFKSPAHKWEMKLDVIDSITLKDYFPEYRLLAVVQDYFKLDEVKELGAEIHASDFVAVNNKIEYLGMISLRAISLDEKSINKTSSTIKKYIDSTIPFVTPDDKLSEALNIIMRYDIDKVAVVEEKRMIGYIRSKDIFEAYNKELKQSKRN